MFPLCSLIRLNETDNPKGLAKNPKEVYYNDKNGFTNKHNTKDGMYNTHQPTTKVGKIAGKVIGNRK